MSSDSYIHHLRRGEPGAPILFVFHGTGGDENQFFDFAGRLMPAATIVSPRGDVSEYGAQRFFRRTGEGVYDMDDLSRATRKMSGFVRSHAAAAQASAVLAFGYSNGANILANLMIEDPGAVDRAALLHPLIPFKPKDAEGLAGRSVLITAGRADPICPAPLTSALANYLSGQGATVDLVWHPGGHELRETEIEALKRFLTEQDAAAA